MDKRTTGQCHINCIHAPGVDAVESISIWICFAMMRLPLKTEDKHSLLCLFEVFEHVNDLVMLVQTVLRVTYCWVMTSLRSLACVTIGTQHDGVPGRISHE